MPIITPVDLGKYLARPIAAGAQANAATEIIDGLEGDLAAYLKRPIAPAEFEDEEVTVSGGVIYPRHTPILSVAGFSYGETEITDDQYVLRSYGLVDIWPGFVPDPIIAVPPPLLLSYTAGLPGDDPTTDFGRKARGVLLRAAARDFNQVVREDLAGVARAVIEGTDLGFHGGVRAGAGGLTETELEGFKRWKRRTVRVAVAR